MVGALDGATVEELERAIFLRSLLQPGGAVFPGENQERMTASVMYNRPLRNGNWASTLAWGRTHALERRQPLQQLSVRIVGAFRHARNYAWTRIRSRPIVRTSCCSAKTRCPPASEETRAGRVEAKGTRSVTTTISICCPIRASAVGAQATCSTPCTAMFIRRTAHPAGCDLSIRPGHTSKGER